MLANLLERKKTHFVLWAPNQTAPIPKLVIGELQLANPVSLKNERSIDMVAAGLSGLFELAPADAKLEAGKVYHYWFEVNETKRGRPPQRIRVTDPAAFTVDWRLRAPALAPPNADEDRQAAAVILYDGTHLIACDPAGELAEPANEPPVDRLPGNNQIVVYELPTAWARISSGAGVERAVGTFRDIIALIEPSAEGANFSDLSVTQPGRSYLVDLGVNTIELLPPADSIIQREWGYATSNFFAPDFDLGFPEGNSSPTANRDMSALMTVCHRQGIRVFADMVMAFWRDGAYEHIDSGDFHIYDPDKHTDDPDALTSTHGAEGKKPRNTFGSTLIRYAKFINTYDPMAGGERSLSPGHQFMLAQLEHWMRDYRIDGVRMDSIENVFNWDFIGDFSSHGRELWRERFNSTGGNGNADSRFIVIGEELRLPLDLFRQNRLDALWNDNFRVFSRAAMLGESADNENFEFTVRKMIECRFFGFDDGARSVNYLTSHDVQGFRQERLWNFLGSSNVGSFEERRKRIKLGFACLLTAVGIPMILAGEEFGDQHDRFDASGQVTQEGGKQVDPVNFSRVDDPSRSGLFEYVARLVKLRTTHPALAVNDTEFIHVDFTPGRRVMAWRRGDVSNPVVVVANFSDFGSEHTANGVAEYRIPNFPGTPTGRRWRDVSQDRDIPADFVGRESLFPWEAKVYALAGS